MEEAVLKELWQSVIDFDEEAAKRAAEKVFELKYDPFEAVVKGLTPAIREMGDRFEKGDVFLPQLVMASDAMMAAVNILEKEISSEKLKSIQKGTVVIGTVKGDIHNIGKNIVGIMLKASGYDVIDLGIEVEPSKFIDEAERSNANIIGASALMTFTASNMSVINEYMEMEGVRGKYKLIFGGGPLTEKWALEMGADGYAPDALKAVELVNELIDF